jgi:FAD/FMN-containing dehydrogenase
MERMSEVEFRPQREPHVPPAGIELFARDMTATIAADMPLDVVQQKLAEVGQWLPIDGDPRLPVGRLVEMNSTGPLRLGFGAWRDLLLGCQFASGRGELITAGGRVVKNVAGYDLTKLMVGQQGILGKIVTITTRTYQKPSHFLAAAFEPDVRRLNELLATTCRPQWAVLNAAALVCGYLGDAAMIEFVETALPKFKPLRMGLPLGGDAELHSFSVRDGSGVAFRASVPPRRIAELVKRAGLEGWVADPAFGIVRGTCSEESFEAVRAAARDVGGSAWRENGEDTREPIVSRLKQAFCAAESADGGKP